MIEFNVRLGDPEAQVVLPMVRDELAPLLEAAARGALETTSCDQMLDPHVGVVLASGGYPGAYEIGAPIAGLDDASALEGVLVFHGGTGVRDHAVVTTGGRVLTVVGRGVDVAEAIDTRLCRRGSDHVRAEAGPDRHRPQGALSLQVSGFRL